MLNYYSGDLISTILILGSLGISLAASFYVNFNYKRYKKVNINSKKTGFDVAREILDRNGLNKVLILETTGELSDHYDPTKKVIKLSHDIYHGSSVASTSVAAHECGHAIQDKEGYTFLRFRNKIVPLVNFSSKAGYIAIMLGILLSLRDLIWVGIALELVILVFQLITLPVEFDASNRALKNISEMQLVNSNELEGSKKMLTSAALTYVASVLTNVIELLRLIIIARSRDE